MAQSLLPLAVAICSSLATVQAAFGGLRARVPLHALTAAGDEDGKAAPLPFFMSRKADDVCHCEFQPPCSCESSISFMTCVKNACESGKCGCEGYDEFHLTCRDMSAHCPSVGLTCVKDHGTASCPISGSAPLQVVMTPLQRNTSAAPVTAPPAPAPKEPAAQKIKMPDVPADPTSGVFAVPTASRCVVIICCQYMLLFSALAFTRTYHEVTATASGTLLRALRAASKTVTYGPMLCVLFIACRMRVEFLSDGKDQPQMWVQNCMYGTTLAVIVMSLVVLIPSLFMQRPIALKKGSCTLEKPASGSGVAYHALVATRYAILAVLYGGITGVLVGIFVYTPPGQNDVSKLPAPAPAVMCTMLLAVLFFVTQLAVAVTGTYSEMTGQSTDHLASIFECAADTVNFAPMLSILFLAARMRALQHDGQPQAWAQHCMYACSGALALTTILAVAVPLALGGGAEVDPVTGQTRYIVKCRTLAIVLDAVRYVIIVGMYGGALGVIASVFMFESPKGPEHTIPVSPTVQCVVNLCIQYFLIYFSLNVAHTLQEFVHDEPAEVEPALQVTFIQAFGLKHLNFLGDKMIATCSVKQKFKRDVVGPMECKTAVVRKSVDPYWNETHELGWNRGDSLEFSVFDQGLLNKKLEGKVIVPADVFYPNGFVGEVPLSGVSKAKLHISIMARPTKETAVGRFCSAVDAAKATVTLAPMLCILFVATRMYALLITDKKGAPQAWVQDAMYMATWSLMVTFIVCMVSTACVDNVQLDEDGNVVSGFRGKYTGIAVTAVRYLTMLSLYGGIITVIVGLFVMTPETANGRGAIPVVSDAVGHTPLSKPPPGPNAITG
eukprot:TRINITY_DN14020_c0_g1_i2.p1 TRINITY_DN14020_c0_g1~~TRINITY_DN14020_c0_g1_i2.p1  ORF type:complete len:838 (+),score=190.53 TRINITY_DN14020_c0_g1_i2:100-2613(+)